MRKKLPVACCLLLSLTAALAQNQNPLPMVSVTGTAVVRVVPDEINLTLGVETRGKSLEEARKSNDDRIKAVLDELKTAGIKQQDIQTDLLNVQPSFGADDNRTKPQWFEVDRILGVKVRDVAKFESVLAATLKAGANRVRDVTYVTSALRKHRDQARSLAVRAAKEKAEALASELGAKIGKVFSIQEDATDGGLYRQWGNSLANNLQVQAVASPGNDDSTPDGGLAVGRISISARVSVSFLMQ